MTTNNKFIHHPTDKKFHTKLSELSFSNYQWFTTYLMIRYSLEITTVINMLGPSWLVMLIYDLKQNPLTIHEMCEKTMDDYERFYQP